MTARIPRLARAVAIAAFLLLALAPIASAQQPTPRLPGQTPEKDTDWTWYLSFPVLLGAGGLAGLVGLSYVMLGRRFFGKEEIPAQKRLPVSRVAVPPPPQVSAPRAPAAGPAAATAPPAGQPAPAEEAPKGEAPKEEAPKEEAPKEEAPKEEAPKEEAPKEVQQPEPAPTAEEKPAEAAPTARVPAALDQETFERVLKEQIDKGVARPVAEGRARAAAVRAAREKSGGG